MDVWLQLIEGTAVDLEELHFRIGGGHLGQHVVELEADNNDNLGAGLGGGLEVLPLCCRIGAFIGLGDAAKRLSHALGPDLAELEEVVDADWIGRDVHEQRLLLGEACADEKSGEGKRERCDAFHGFRPAGVKADKAGPRGHVRPGGTERGASLWSGFSATSFRKPPSIWRVTTVRADGLPPDDNCVVAYEEGDRPRDLDRLDVPGQLRTDQLRKDVARSLSGE